MPYPGPPSQLDVGWLYQAHHGWIRAWLNKKLGNSSDAAELAHGADEDFTAVQALA